MQATGKAVIRVPQKSVERRHFAHHLKTSQVLLNSLRGDPAPKTDRSVPPVMVQGPERRHYEDSSKEFRDFVEIVYLYKLIL